MGEKIPLSSSKNIVQAVHKNQQAILEHMFVKNKRGKGVNFMGD